MKILHTPFCFHPDPIGGTEVYVQNLALAQKSRGAEPVIAAPAPRDEQYTVAGLKVCRFGMGDVGNLQDFYGEGDPVAAASFARLLADIRPEVAHFHAFTRGVSLRLVRLAKQAGIPVVFTYHTPTVSCQRGTLLRWGTELCDGRMEVRMCTGCSLEGLGLKEGLARLVSRVPPAAGRALGAAKLAGGLWTALRMTELLTLRHAAVRNLMEEVDQVVSLCSWTTDLLLGNGVPREKILLCRHGLPAAHAASAPRHASNPATRNSKEPCRIAFLGRLTPVKGLDVLIPAITADPEMPVTLDIYGLAGSGEQSYEKQLQKSADARIRFLKPIAPDEVIAALSRYDLLAVPSQWLETGPLVVLEAFAAGIPVIGSDLGGIRELVRQEMDGLLVEPGSVSGWSAALRRLTDEPGLLGRLQNGVKPPRTMEAVAADMLSLYGQLLTGAPHPALSSSY